MGLLDRLMGVPGAIPPYPPRAPGTPLPRPKARGLGAVLGLSSFDAGPLVQIPGIPRPTGRAPVDPGICRREKIPAGARGTVATLERMGELAIEASQDIGFVQIVRGVVRSCAPRDAVCEADAILQFVREMIDYRYDPLALEHISSPGWALLVDGQEDCDGQATLIAAMNISVGRGARFVAYRLDPNDPEEFSHVMAQFGFRGPDGNVVWLGQDSIVSNPRLGWEPPESEQVGPPQVYVVMEP